MNSNSSRQLPSRLRAISLRLARTRLCLRVDNLTGSRSPATIARRITMPVNSTDIADHIGQLHVHLRERFLHVLNACTARRHQSLPLPKVGSQYLDFLRGTKRIVQQAESVQ